MLLSKIISISNAYTDESVTTANALLFVNEAIALLNTKYKILLPFFEDATTDYDALGESWIRRILVNYVNYGVKMNDTSLQEADRYKAAFDLAVIDFASNYLDELDPEYLGETMNNVYTIDTTNAIDMGWFTGRGRGGL